MSNALRSSGITYKWALLLFSYPTTCLKAILVSVVVITFPITPASFSHLSTFFSVMLFPVKFRSPNLPKFLKPSFKARLSTSDRNDQTALSAAEAAGVVPPFGFAAIMRLSHCTNDRKWQIRSPSRNSYDRERHHCILSPKKRQHR